MSSPAAMAIAFLVAAAAPAPSAHRPSVHVVTINDLAFGAAPAGIRRGDTVEWVNDDVVLHSVTARDSSFDSDVAPGARIRFVVNKAGVIAYFCKYHPGMTGQLTVAN